MNNIKIDFNMSRSYSIESYNQMIEMLKES